MLRLVPNRVSCVNLLVKNARRHASINLQIAKTSYLLQAKFEEDQKSVNQNSPHFPIPSQNSKKLIISGKFPTEIYQQLHPYQQYLFLLIKSLDDLNLRENVLLNQNLDTATFQHSLNLPQNLINSKFKIFPAHVADFLSRFYRTELISNTADIKNFIYEDDFTKPVSSKQVQNLMTTTEFYKDYAKNEANIELIEFDFSHFEDESSSNSPMRSHDSKPKTMFVADLEKLSPTSWHNFEKLLILELLINFVEYENRVKLYWMHQFLDTQDFIHQLHDSGFDFGEYEKDSNFMEQLDDILAYEDEKLGNSGDLSNSAGSYNLSNKNVTLMTSGAVEDSSIFELDDLENQQIDAFYDTDFLEDSSQNFSLNFSEDTRQIYNSKMAYHTQKILENFQKIKHYDHPSKRLTLDSEFLDPIAVYKHESEKFINFYFKPEIPTVKKVKALDIFLKLKDTDSTNENLNSDENQRVKTYDFETIFDSNLYNSEKDLQLGRKITISPLQSFKYDVKKSRMNYHANFAQFKEIFL